MSGAAADSDSTLALLRQVNSGGQHLLKSCMSLGAALPVEPLEVKASWPELLGHFKTIGQQLAQVSAKAERQLEHSVPIPTEPAASPQGQPTMVVPELLRTKKDPEHEKADADVRRAVAHFLPTEGSEKAREEEAAVRFGQFSKTIFQHNKDLEALKESFAGLPQRSRLKRKCADTVTRFAAKRSAKRSEECIELLTLLHTGKAGANLTRKDNVVKTEGP